MVLRWSSNDHQIKSWDSAMSYGDRPVIFLEDLRMDKSFEDIPEDEWMTVKKMGEEVLEIDKDGKYNVTL